MSKGVKIGIIAVLLLVALFAIYFLTKSVSNSSSAVVGVAPVDSPVDSNEQKDWWTESNPFLEKANS